LNLDVFCGGICERALENFKALVHKDLRGAKDAKTIKPNRSDEVNRSARRKFLSATNKPRSKTNTSQKSA